MRSHALRSRAHWIFTLPAGLSLLVIALIPFRESGALAQVATQTTAGQSLGIKSVPNLRDLGGYKTSDGKTVTARLVYRSNQLSGISPGDMEELAELKLKTIFDLRTAEEREKRPEELPPGVNYVVLDVLADSP